MFSLKVIDTDAFLDMPISSRLLYYELSIRADDDGFISSPKKITRMVGCSEDDLKMLIMKQFIIPFTSGVCVIRDWRIHNYIQKDRYHETQYVDEKSQLILEKNGMYTKRVHDVYKMDTEVRLELGKDRLEIGEDRGVGEGTPPKAADSFPYDDYRKAFIDCCPSLPKPNAIDKWTANRKKALRAKKISVDEFRDVCKKIERSEFLTGRDGKWHGCSFDWILKPANWQKITEGNYENKNHPIRQVESGDREPSYDLDEYMNNALHTSISYQTRGEENE